MNLDKSSKSMRKSLSKIKENKLLRLHQWWLLMEDNAKMGLMWVWHLSITKISNKAIMISQ
jgi:hypothetical protein